jgi:hypothetical protein
MWPETATRCCVDDLRAAGERLRLDDRAHGDLVAALEARLEVVGLAGRHHPAEPGAAAIRVRGRDGRRDHDVRLLDGTHRVPREDAGRAALEDGEPLERVEPRAAEHDLAFHVLAFVVGGAAAVADVNQFAGDVAGGRVAAKRDGRVVDVVDLAGAEALRDPELALRGLPELAARELLDLRSGEPVLLREVHHRLALAERSDGVLGRRAHALVGHELQDVVHRALARRFHDDRAHLVPAEERAVFLLLGSERRGRDDECRRGELQGLTHGYLPQLG